MQAGLSDYFRFPLDSLGSMVFDSCTGEPGFFQFGAATMCYGRCDAVETSRSVTTNLHDALNEVRLEERRVRLPFDPGELIENLRRERYEEKLRPDKQSMVNHQLIRKAYYLIRILLPVSVRRHLQKAYFRGWEKLPFPSWPVDLTVDTLHERFLKLSMKASGVRRVPFIWFWPEGALSCLIMTHDVESSAGRDFSSRLMDLDESYGFRASFQVIPEGSYTVPDEFVGQIRSRGFEFNIHDLNHDGRLYQEREEFLRRARKINQYVHRYNARGFRAGAMYRNPDWYDAFEFSYDMSVPNVAHLEPTRGGCCTVFPFFIGKILELPLTMTQDYSLFYVLNDQSLDLWKKQVNLIRRGNGLMSFNSHPDYLIRPRQRKLYESLLDYLRQMVARDKIWTALPGDVDLWWRARSQMRLVRHGSDWVIEGPEHHRARVAHAVLDGDRLVYEIP